MSTPPSPTAVATVRVPAGTTAVQALKEAGVPLKGPDGAVVDAPVAALIDAQARQIMGFRMGQAA